MKIPDKIKMSSQTINIVFKGRVLDEKNEYCHGIAYPSLNKIELSTLREDGRFISESMIADTFMHEIFETIAANFGMDISHEQILCLTSALLDVIRTNNLDFRK